MISSSAHLEKKKKSSRQTPCSPLRISLVFEENIFVCKGWVVLSSWRFRMPF
jgi:hypothetical protein